MVDYNKLNRDPSKISSALNAQIKEIMGQKGKADKIDHHKEYAQLQELLNGGKYKGDNKEYIEGLMIDYEDQYETSKSIREKVLDIVGKDKKVDDENEKSQLESLKKGADGFDKEYIKRVIDGKEAVDVNPDSENNLLPPTKGKDDKQPQLPEKPNFGVGFKEDILKDTDEQPKVVKSPYYPKESNDKVKKEPYPVPVDNSVKINQPDNSVKINEPIQGVDQDGKVNVIADDGATVIIGVGAKEAAKAGKIGDEDETPAGDTSEPKKLTAKEKAEARSYGAQINDLLTNVFTERDEQITVSNIIRNNINSDNVLEFLRGYEMKGSGDPFFEQMMREWDFEEKEGLIRDVAEKLMKNLEANGWTDDASDIATILAKGYLTKEDAKALDEIVKLHIPQLD